MKIYTKTGDKGQTSLFGGKRVSKSHIRIESYGTIDELNSYIGLVKDQNVNEKRKSFLTNIQERLFTIGASLAADPEKSNLKKPDLLQSDVEALEVAIDNLEDELEPLKNFILPGGHQSISFCQIARCVCRRAERLAIGLSDESPIEEIILQYLNRLSDYLFTLCRAMHKDLEVGETPWITRQ